MLSKHTFKNLSFKKVTHLYSVLLMLMGFSCIDNEALRGRLTVTLTDAPVDAGNIREVNIAIKSVEVLKNGSEVWQTIKSFEEPKTINLLDYTEGEFYDLTEQYLSPGDYDGIRLELNLANVDNGLTVFPQSNIVFTNGLQETLFVQDGRSKYVENKDGFSIITNQATFLTLDFDARKSVILTNGGYKLDPFIRVVDTQNTGEIDGQFRDFADYPKTIVLAYKPGSFSANEAAGERAFGNAITSTRINASIGGRFTLAFLTPGNYDLVFAKLDNNGNLSSMIGRMDNIKVTQGETSFVCGQVNAPQVQGNCVQIKPL